MELRKWQQECVDDYVECGLPQNYLISATPGAGKTAVAMSIATLLFEQDRIDRVVTISPTLPVRDNWVQIASRFGIELRPNDLDWNVALDGDACTYASLLGDYRLKLLSAGRGLRTLYIADEVHHAALEGWNGSGNQWGNATTQVVDGANNYRLGLTGTPWRERGAGHLPFISYTQDGSDVVAEPDFPYSYAEAIRDGVCRTVEFKTFGATLEPLSRHSRDELIRAGEDVSDERASELLGAMFDWRNNPLWLREIIKASDAVLTAKRFVYPSAGALLVARDIEMARACAKLIQDITGHNPVLVTSQEDQAHQQLRRFAESNDRWLVAVGMVSEGVDIPRLMVGVYATNRTTMLSFRQITGRFIRKTGDDGDQAATIFIPADHRLAAHAAEIEQEVSLGGEMYEQVERQRLELGESASTSAELQLMLVDAYEENTIFRGDELTGYIDQARAACKETGIPETYVPNLARYLSAKQPAAAVRTLDRPARVIPEAERHKRLRSQVSKAANGVALRLGVPYQEFHTQLAAQYGGWREDLSNETLEQMLADLRNPELWS